MEQSRKRKATRPPSSQISKQKKRKVAEGKRGGARAGETTDLPVATWRRDLSKTRLSVPSTVGDEVSSQCPQFFCVQNTFANLVGPDLGRNQRWIYSAVYADGWSALKELVNDTNRATQRTGGEARFPENQRLVKIRGVQDSELLGLLCSNPPDPRVPLGKYLLRVQELVENPRKKKHVLQPSIHVIGVDTINRIIIDSSPNYPVAMPLTLEVFAMMGYFGTDGGARLNM
jgi:hypothetical protein